MPSEPFAPSPARGVRQRPARPALLVAVVMALLLGLGAVALTPQRATAAEGTSTDGKLRLTYVPSRPSVAPGDPVTYRYELTNLTGDTWIYGTWANRTVIASFTDPVGCPGGNVAPSPATGWLGSPATGEYIAPGGSAWVECTTTVASTQTSTVTLTGWGYASSVGGPITQTGSTVSATETVTVSSQADYRLSLSATPQSVAPGAQVSYAATISNAGPVTGSTYGLTVTLPDGFTGITAPGGCAVAGQTVTCDDQPALAAGAGRTFSFTARAGATTGTTTASAAASNGGTPSTSVTVTVARAATPGTSNDGDFTLTKTPSRAAVPAGGASVTYTYTVRNNATTRANRSTTTPRTTTSAPR